MDSHPPRLFACSNKTGNFIVSFSRLRIWWLFSRDTSAWWLFAVTLYSSSFARAESLFESLPCSRLLGLLISFRSCSSSLSELLVIEVNQTQSEKSLKCKCVKESESFKRLFVFPRQQHQCSLTNLPAPFPSLADWGGARGDDPRRSCHRWCHDPRHLGAGEEHRALPHVSTEQERSEKRTVPKSVSVTTRCSSGSERRPRRRRRLKPWRLVRTFAGVAQALGVTGGRKFQSERIAAYFYSRLRNFTKQFIHSEVSLTMWHHKGPFSRSVFQCPYMEQDVKKNGTEYWYCDYYYYFSRFKYFFSIEFFFVISTNCKKSEGCYSLQVRHRELTGQLNFFFSYVCV